MLPGVNGQQRLQRPSHGVLVVSLDNLDGAVLGVLDNEGPTGTLDAGKLGVGEVDQVVEGPVLVDDGLGEGSRLRRQLTTTLLGRGQVLPEEVVVGVATTVELDVLLQLDQSLDITLGLGLRVLFDSLVQAVDVGLVVLGVVEFVDLARNVWFQVPEVPLEVWKGNLGSDLGSGSRRRLGSSSLGNGVHGWDRGKRRRV